MKKMLYVRGNYPINPRSKKMKEALDHKYDVKFIFWDRKLKKTFNEGDDYFYQSKGIVNSKLKKLIAIVGFYRYLKQVIREYEPEVIYAYHWDMFVLVQLALRNKEIDVIYDVSDMPDFNGIKFKVLKFIEESFINQKVYIILASKYFTPFYKKFKNPKIIIDNKPNKSVELEKTFDFEGKYDFNVIYVGSIKYKEILVKLVNVVKDIPVNLLFFGGGFDEEFMREYCSNIEHVYFFGQYSMKDIESFYKVGDVAWAAYPSKSINVKHATSNKYFESLVNKVPCIFAEDTELGKDTNKRGLGLTVDPYNEESIRELLLRVMNRDLLNGIRNNIEKLNDENLFWESEAKKLERFVRDIDGGTENN